MPTFRVGRTMITNEVVEVEAKDEQEAIALATEGEGELVGGGNFCVFEDVRIIK